MSVTNDIRRKRGQRPTTLETDQRTQVTQDAEARRTDLDRQYAEMFLDPKNRSVWEDIQKHFSPMRGTMLKVAPDGHVDPMATAARNGAAEVILHISQRIERGRVENITQRKVEGKLK